MKGTSLVFLLLACLTSAAQTVKHSGVWVADLGNGTYKNPILHADYSDPDAVRVGDDYYMVSSSFNHIPGLPVLHSRDLVNWSLVTYVLKRQPPFDHFSLVQHGNGVWAPSIRYHKGEFYIYYPDPDFGIFLVKAKNITGPWTEPMLVEEGKGLIDPCPLWDDDGQVYLVHAYAGSRAGIKSLLVLKKMNAAGTKTMDEGVIVYDGHDQDPTLEGPKFYKRNGYYYIFAPAGGVATGWQLALRSRNIYGPYERKIVMDQGGSPVNGPHQGAWVNTRTGEDWFLHFQDKEAYGRVVHLQPMKWVNDWPVIGSDKDADGKGEPVMIHKKPNIGKSYPFATPPESDEFSGLKPGLQWQWQANPRPYWAFPNNGQLRLFSYPVTDTNSFWNQPNLYLQKFPAEEFMATARVDFKPRREGDRSGLMVFGLDYAFISLVKKTGGNYLSFGSCKDADKANPHKLSEPLQYNAAIIYFRVEVSKGALCRFSYSEDGKSFRPIGEKFQARPGKWVGAKMGLFCTATVKTNDAGFADVDWFRVEPLAAKEL
ncbi:MAG TPA: glycoside hydrolase 43 family protein [Chitinophagaceae bacterium]|nr:glycoside hydrolase 43 family protein [Chitinophagaceae bacterium]